MASQVCIGSTTPCPGWVVIDPAPDRQRKPPAGHEHARRAAPREELQSLLAADIHVAAEHPELAGTETADDIRGWIELLPS